MNTGTDLVEWTLVSLIFLCIFGIPIVVTIINISALVKIPENPLKKEKTKIFSIVTVVVGFIDSGLYLAMIDVSWNDWHEQLYNDQIHTPIATEHELTIVIFSLIGIAGYFILNHIDISKTPPLVTVMLISCIYIGIAVAVLWTIQITALRPIDFLILALYPFNLLILAAGLLRRKLTEYKNTIGNRELRNDKLQWLNQRLLRSESLPLYAFLLMLPVIGIVICILLLFGQRPDSIIQAWTQTSDWTLSTKQAPPNLYVDEHYLCTVAAGGHKKIVKPQREGSRHGHRVAVNRQLCIANAFEQVLEERTPRFHKAVRGFYDKYGFPVARLIRTSLAADIVYIVMKPLEWIFLIVLYLTDIDPEKRIAVQYLPKKDKESLLAYIDGKGNG